MLFIDDGIISITQNDDAVLEINIQTSTGDPFVMAADDTLTMSVREIPNGNSPLLMSITTAPGSNRIILRGADTRAIPSGRYSYDVQLNRANGTRFTILPDNITSVGNNWKNFVVLGEVTIP